MRNYVAAMKNALVRTIVITGAETSCVRRTGDRYVLAGATGELQEFDHLVFATNAAQALRLLTGMDGVGEHRAALGGFRYFETSIAVHGDRRVMPPREKDWSVFNIQWDGRRSSTTVWRRHAGGNPVFRSWIPNVNPMSPLYHVTTYCHPVTDPQYFRAPELLDKSQGQRNLWFAGAYAHDIDSHESAIRSAMRVAQELALQSVNLKRLVGGSGLEPRTFCL